MSRILIRLTHSCGVTGYCEWSDNVDAPVSEVMSRPAMEKYLLTKATNEHAPIGRTPGPEEAREVRIETDHELGRLIRRWQRVDDHGTSRLDWPWTGEQYVETNHGGDNGQRLSVDALIEQFASEELSRQIRLARAGKEGEQG